MRIGTIHQPQVAKRGPSTAPAAPARPVAGGDRKSTRLNSSHDQISYAVFCLKKKKTHEPVPSGPQKQPLYYHYALPSDALSRFPRQALTSHFPLSASTSYPSRPRVATADAS